MASASLSGPLLASQLGLPVGVALYEPLRGTPIHMDNVKCAGSEAKLANCAFNGWGQSNCNHFEDVSLRCKGTELASTMSIAYVTTCITTALSVVALALALIVLVAVQRQLDRGMVPMMLPVMHVAEGRRAQPSESLAHVDGHGNDC